MKTIPFTDLQSNAEQLFGHCWMLITAGKPGDFNTMTASWGGLGFLWNRPVAFVFVRPNRYTHEFISREGAMTLSFMPERYRDALTYCGRHSGRDVDKMAETGLRLLTLPGGLVAIDDADLVLECRIMYTGSLQQAGFSDWSEVAPRWYDENNPLHQVYICAISVVHTRE